MNSSKSRRDFLTEAGAIAVAGLSIAAVRSTGALGQTPATAGLEYRTVAELASGLARRQFSATELVDHAIARIEALDGPINAVVVRDFERARSAAAQADAALRRGEQRPLLGIPMTVKESFHVAGLPTTWGIPRFKNWRAAQDAVAVARAKAAGAIVLGKTNVPLLLHDVQSFNEIYGTTNNPWDLTRTPGGSSGGAAASLAAGYVPLELGSDLGGSLRAPAHYCGVFAHKPSLGLVPLRGHTPPATPALPVETDLAVAGPMARNAADLELLLDVIAGPDEPMATGYRLALGPARHDRLQGFRVLIVDTHPLLPTAQSIRTAIDRFAEKLGKTGAKVARSSPLLPDLAQMARIHMLLLMSFAGADMPAEAHRRLQGVAAGLPAEDQSLSAMRVRGTVLSHRDWIAADRVRKAMQQQWRDLFREWDVVVCPAEPVPAFPHDHTPPQARRIVIDGSAFPFLVRVVWSGMATLPGLPATAVPIARTETGLPIGVQVIGPYLEDRTTLAFARLVDREFGGFVRPPRFA
jgi:amidase